MFSSRRPTTFTTFTQFTTDAVYNITHRRSGWLLRTPQRGINSRPYGACPHACPHHAPCAKTSHSMAIGSTFQFARPASMSCILGTDVAVPCPLHAVTPSHYLFSWPASDGASAQMALKDVTSWPYVLPAKVRLQFSTQAPLNLIE